MHRAATRAGAALLLAFGTLAGPGPSPASGQERPPRLWAVVVGAERYRPPLAPREGALVDAQRVAHWLGRTAGWASDQILELNDAGDPRPGRPEGRAYPLRPTRANLDWALEKWLAARARPGDVVLFVFAGRGGSTPAGEGVWPLDARPGEPPWSPERGVERLLRDSRCSAVLSWVDAPMDRPDAGSKLLARLARWPGSSAWVATAEGPDPRHSAFLGALRRALGADPKPLLATLGALDRDPAARASGFRQLGGIPGELNLFRDRFAAVGGRTPGLLIQKGHSDGITGLAIFADGRTMATSSQDSTIRLWDPAVPDRPLLRVLSESLNGVTAMAIDPGGRHLVGGDGMGEVVAWDLVSGDPRPIVASGPRAHKSLVRSLAFLPEVATSGPSKDAPPRRFVSTGLDGRCAIWEIRGRSLEHQLASIPTTRDVKVAAAETAGGPAAFVAIGDDGKIREFDAANRPIGSRAFPPGKPSAIDLDAAGRLEVVGLDDGRVVAWDLAENRLVLGVPSLGGPISALRLGPDDRTLVVAAGGDLKRLRLDRPGPVETLATGAATDPFESIEFSSDGAWLAATTRSGDLKAWAIGPDGAASPVALGGLDSKGQFSTIAFGPASGPPWLAAGENDGGVRRWDLKSGKPGPRIAPYRGRVRHLGASADGRYLLEITEFGRALVWDLKEGRGVRTLEGTWSAGAFLPDGRLAMARHPSGTGEVVVVDAREGRPALGVSLENQASGSDYARLVASKDGKRIAALPAPGRPEDVFVWDLPSGRLRIIEGAHDRAPSAVAFSGDGSTLLTAGEEGAVKLWDLRQAKLVAPIATYPDAGLASVTAAALGPGDRRPAVAAGLTAEGEGAVVFWPDEKSKPTRLGAIRGRALSVAFLAGGRYAVAAGFDRRIFGWDLLDPRRPVEVDVRASSDPAGPEAAPHHTERINDLLAWPVADGPSLVSGSDDSSARFWKVEPSGQPGGRSTLRLIGSITAAPAEPAEAGARARAEGPTPDVAWVAFTPEGVFDGSLDGDRLVTFGDGRKVEPLDQYASRLFRPLLADQFRRGLSTPRNSFAPPPPILIEAPDDFTPARDEVELKISLGDPKLKAEDVRLYQNDAPVRDGSGEEGQKVEPTSTPGEVVARIRLVPGDNRLYAMAARAEGIDARSTDLTLYHSGANRPGKVHVLALGVGKYLRNALEYPTADAREISDFLNQKGVGAGRKILLDDDKVAPRSVREAFSELRREVRGHPEDTVVVFLAGHTDVLRTPDGESRYSLMLPKFPFPESDPARAVLRGPEAAGAPLEAKPDQYLMYSSIHRDLTGLDALQRVVIVDACQAGAVLDDPGVRALEQIKAMDRETRLARTGYLLASRRGEPEGESPELKHGLLTYVLLRGMGAPVVAPPRPVDALDREKTADANLDGTITTRELRRYVDLTLPALADALAVRRRGPEPTPAAAGPPKPPGPAPTFDPKLAADGPAFPLVRAPKAPAVAEGRP